MKAEPKEGHEGQFSDTERITVIKATNFFFLFHVCSSTGYQAPIQKYLSRIRGILVLEIKKVTQGSISVVVDCI